MKLYIMRHAWAAKPSETDWPDDELRPLTGEGRRRFAQVVKKLSARGVQPGAIAASPLTRCLQTAEIMADGLPNKPEIVALDSLRPGSDLEGLLNWTALRAQTVEEIAWVGHAPDVGWLTAATIGMENGAIHFPKGAAACVRFDGPIAKGAGELRWLVTAKMLGC